MAKKQITKQIKLQIPAGKATPAPPVGTVLGPAGINLQEFCTKFNDATRDKMGDVLPVVITIYEDRTFDFVLKTPPAAFLLKKVAKVKSGASKGETVATITKEQLKEVAESYGRKDAEDFVKKATPQLRQYAKEELKYDKAVKFVMDNIK